MRSDGEGSETGSLRLYTQDFFGEPFGHSGTPWMREAGIAALVVDRCIVFSQRAQIPGRSEDLEESGRPVADLSAPAVVDRVHRFGMPAHARHCIQHKILIERGIRHPLQPVRISPLPDLVPKGRRHGAGIDGIGQGEYVIFTEDFRRGKVRPRLGFRQCGIFPGKVFPSGSGHRRGESPGCLDRQHLESHAGFRAAGILEAGAEAFVPAVECR